MQEYVDVMKYSSAVHDLDEPRVNVSWHEVVVHCDEGLCYVKRGRGDVQCEELRRQDDHNRIMDKVANIQHEESARSQKQQHFQHSIDQASILSLSRSVRL